MGESALPDFVEVQIRETFTPLYASEQQHTMYDPLQIVYHNLQQLH